MPPAITCPPHARQAAQHRHEARAAGHDQQCRQQGHDHHRRHLDGGLAHLFLQFEAALLAQPFAETVQRFLHRAAVLVDLGDQAADGRQVVVVEPRRQPRQRLLAGAAAHIQFGRQPQLVGQHRQHLGEFLDQHLQALVDRQAHPLQQPQQVDQQRQFVGRLPPAPRHAPAHEPLGQHVADGETEERRHEQAQRRAADAAPQVQRHRRRRQQQRQREARHDEAQPRRARVLVARQVHQFAVLASQQGLGETAFAQALAERVGGARGRRQAPALRAVGRRGGQGRDAALARGQGLVHHLAAAVLPAQAPRQAQAQDQHGGGDQHQRHRQHGRDIPGLDRLHGSALRWPWPCDTGCTSRPPAGRPPSAAS